MTEGEKKRMKEMEGTIKDLNRKTFALKEVLNSLMGSVGYLFSQMHMDDSRMAKLSNQLWERF